MTTEKITTLHLAYSINNNYVNHLIVTLYSLLKNNKRYKIHAHILSSDISKGSIKNINSLAEFHDGFKTSYYKVNPADFSNMAITMGYITLETYYRLVLADILPQNVKKIIYLDADILVVGDISPLYKIDVNGLYGAGVPDIYLDSDDEYKKLIGLSGETYYNAGVFLLNLEKIRNDKLTKKLLKNAKNKVHKYQDQDAINVTFLGNTIAADREFNYQIKDKEFVDLPTDKMTILHYSGSFKPWNRDRTYDAFSTLYDEYSFEASKFINERNANIKYGLLKYSTDNVGDSVQGIAAKRFIPRIDYYFERDNMDATKTTPGETVKVVINGWWGDGPENWPSLDPNLQILPISMYAEDRIQAEFKKPRSVMYLNHFGPVGARSRGTSQFLDSIGVDNYFSGCMTLTLNPDKNIKKANYILAVDVPDSVYEVMRAQTSRPIIRLGVLRNVTKNTEEQYKLAEFYLYLYQSAHSVITARLHTMLPSIALGTPVLFLNNILDGDNVRFSGLAELAHNLRAEDYIADPKRFDIDKPPKNKNDYLKIRRSLEKTVKQFTGYISDESFLTEPLDSFISNPPFLQATIGSSSLIGDLIEQNAILNEKLAHKEHHVEELVSEINTWRSEYGELKDNFSQRIVHNFKYNIRSIKNKQK